jgi:hypothetical protein
VASVARQILRGSFWSERFSSQNRAQQEGLRRDFFSLVFGFLIFGEKIFKIGKSRLTEEGRYNAQTKSDLTKKEITPVGG